MDHLFVSFGAEILKEQDVLGKVVAFGDNSMLFASWVKMTFYPSNFWFPWAMIILNMMGVRRQIPTTLSFPFYVSFKSHGCLGYTIMLCSKIDESLAL